MSTGIADFRSAMESMGPRPPSRAELADIEAQHKKLLPLAMDPDPQKRREAQAAIRKLYVDAYGDGTPVESEQIKTETARLTISDDGFMRALKDNLHPGHKAAVEAWTQLNAGLKSAPPTAVTI
jgi:hypothetical protein